MRGRMGKNRVQMSPGAQNVGGGGERSQQWIQECPVKKRQTGRDQCPGSQEKEAGLGRGSN